MTKFCTTCGKKLENNEKCSCNEKSEVLGDCQELQPIIPTVGLFDDFGSILKGSFTHPVSTIVRYSTDSNLIISIIFMVICACSFGVYTYCWVKYISNSFPDTGSGFYTLASIASFRIKFIPIFFRQSFFVIIYFVVLAGMITLIGKVIFKANTNFKKVIIVLGLSSVTMICALIASSILLYIKLKIAFICLLVGMIFSLIYLASVTSDSLNVSKDKVAYTLVPSIAVASFVMLYVLPKLFLLNIK